MTTELLKDPAVITLLGISGGSISFLAYISITQVIKPSVDKLVGDGVNSLTLLNISLEKLNTSISNGLDTINTKFDVLHSDIVALTKDVAGLNSKIDEHDRLFLSNNIPTNGSVRKKG